MAPANWTFGPYIPHLYGDSVQAEFNRHAYWVIGAVNTTIAWPEHDLMVRYDGDDFILRGAADGDKRFQPNICLPCRSHEEIHFNAALAKIYKFASILGWFKRGCVDIVGHMGGSRPFRYDSGRKGGLTIAGGPQGFDCNYMPVLADGQVRRALAFWREGESLNDVHSGYAFLSYYKVIESQFTKGKNKGLWINAQYPLLDGDALARVKELEAGGKDVGLHIFESCRSAVAHAALGEEQLDPDLPQDKRRIAKDLVIIRALAHRYIHDVHRVPDDMDEYRHRDRLEAAYRYIDAKHLKKLHEGGSVPKRKLGLNGLTVSVNLWPHEPNPHLSGLVFSVVSAIDGQVLLDARSSDGLLSLVFLWNFQTRRADPGLIESTVDEAAQDFEKMIAIVEYRRAALMNGVVEIMLPSGAKVQCEMVWPVNVDIAATAANWDEDLARIRKARDEAATRLSEQ